MGLEMDTPILYKHASLRYFAPNEHHIRRYCTDDVLLLVFKGVLRFSENGRERTVKAGEYYIQKRNTFQDGVIASDSPHYLYVHFQGEYRDSPTALPLSGSYDQAVLHPLMEQLDHLAHSGAAYTEQNAVFLQLLTGLYHPRPEATISTAIERYLAERPAEKITLDDLVKRFGYSKNQIILLFKKQYGQSPIAYHKELRLRKAKQLMESTSRGLGDIAEQCGFGDYSQFYKAFYGAEHLSPAAWRLRIRQTPTP